MADFRIVILGLGAAGTAAAKELIKNEVDVHLVGPAGACRYNRTLVNKGVAAGLIEPTQAALPHPGVPVRHDTASAVDINARSVTLASGASMQFDGLIVATGSAPRLLPHSLPGLTQAVRAGGLTTLHSLNDAVRIRDALAGRDSQGSRVIIAGAGLVAAETAALLHRAGHDVALIARSAIPGQSALGLTIADHIAETHRTHVSTYFGRSTEAVAIDKKHVSFALDDGTRVHGDLAIVALGTTPTAPQSWPGELSVDSRLRVANAPGIYGAGGVATHRHGALPPWRIDHWADAAAQGAHAAHSLLHDFGLSADPGPYRPRSTYAARIYGQNLNGAGHAGAGTTERLVSADPLLVIHERNGVPVGVLGLDAGRRVADWVSRLHRRP